MSAHRGFSALFYRTYGTIGTHREGFAALAFSSRGFDWCYRINCLRNYLRKLERRPKWRHIRFTYDILSFLWSVQPQESPLRIREKSTALVFAAPTAEDHPRACGEKTPGRNNLYVAQGSPPRMRGKDEDFTIKNHFAGITPAHAGKRCRSPCRVSQTGDHPRACGEK